jgi:acetoin utilization protein AcuB
MLVVHRRAAPEEKPMLASDVMTEDPLWVAPQATTGEAIRKLLESGVRHLPVLQDGVVVGMLSERDLRSGMNLLMSALENPDQLTSTLAEPAASLMTSKVLSVAPNSDLKDAVDLMLAHHVGAVPVVDPESDKLVGIISYVDVLRATNELLWGLNSIETVY